MQSFNPLVEGYQDHLYEIYRHFREKDPVHRASEGSPSMGAWYLFRYSDVSFVLKDPRFVREYAVAVGSAAETVETSAATSAAPSAQSGSLGSAEVESELPAFQPVSFWQMAGQWMLFRDPPDHTRLRQLVNKAFVPRVVEGLSGRIQEIANELVQPALRDGGMDLIADFAFPLPVTVIAELLGIPAQDRAKLRTWSNALMAAINGLVTEQTMNAANQATAELSEYLAHVIAQRRREPADDLLTGLIQAREKEDRLSEQELVAMAILLLVAGHETTVNLIGNGVHALIHHPEQMLLLRREPGWAANAVEEILRYDAPVQMTTRFAAADLIVGGKRIRRGDDVVVVIGSANRDPEVNEDPDRFDVTRQQIRHLGFGGGIHYCLGAPLARLEGRIALTTLLSQATTIRLAEDRPIYREGMVNRGFVRLPVELR